MNKLEQKFYNLFHNKRNNIKPLVIFDLDQTLIGNVKLLTQIETISHILYKKPAITNQILCNAFKQGLLRPHFVDIINYLRDKAIIIIYTCSTNAWGNIVIDAIQNYVGYNFVSKSFTREHAYLSHFKNNSIKSIEYIISIMNAEGYPVSINNAIMFDDNPVLDKSENNKLVMVKPYTYKDISIVKYIINNKLVINVDAINALEINDSSLHEFLAPGSSNITNIYKKNGEINFPLLTILIKNELHNNNNKKNNDKIFLKIHHLMQKYYN